MPPIEPATAPVAPKETGDVRDTPTPVAKRGGRWLVLGVVFLLFTFHVVRNGYTCMRSDHVTHIPLVLMEQDSSVFPRDWFLQNYAHARLRFYHVQMIRAAWAALGPGLGIFALYAAFSLTALSAWLAISRKAFGSIGPGVLATLMAAYWTAGELGQNFTFEDILIPRWEAQALAYWGLYFALSRRPVVAGLLFGLAGYFHPAIPGFYVVVLATWMLVGTASGARRRDAAWLFGVFVLVFLPHVVFLKAQYVGAAPSSGAPVVSAERAIRLCAWLRHPHHMEPRLWGWKWGEFALFVLLVGLVWHRQTQPAARDLGRITIVVLAWLALATPFVAIWPIEGVVLAQPFRLLQVIYLCGYLLLAAHAWHLLTNGGPFCVLRGFSLVVAGGAPVLAVPVPIVEIYILVRRRLRATGTDTLASIAILAILTTAGVLDSDYRRVAMSALIAAILWGAARKGRWLERRRAVAWCVAVGCAAGLAFFASFHVLPYAKWIEHPYENRSAWARSLNYQLDPMPQRALERMGVWARENTASDALFMIPPQLKYDGFRLWSHRSVFFSAKFFPYNMHGLAEWQKRYLLLRGVASDKQTPSNPEVVEALNDAGLGGLGGAYERLTAEKVLAIADEYRVNYIATPTVYDHPRLRLVHTEIVDPHRAPHRRDAPLRLYKIVPGPTRSTTHHPEKTGETARGGLPLQRNPNETWIDGVATI